MDLIIIKIINKYYKCYDSSYNSYFKENLYGLDLDNYS